MATDIGSIIARLYVDRSQFTRGLEEAKAEARAFGDVIVPVEADITRFDAAAAEVLAEKRVVAEPVETPVGMNAGPFDVGAAQVEAMKAALARPVVIPVELDPSKLNLFTRLVGGGEDPGDVARFLGFSKQELSSALGTMAMQAAEEARGELAQAGEYAAEQMVAGWMAAAQRELQGGDPIGSGFYRLLTGGAEPYMSTGGPIPMGPSETNWRFFTEPLMLPGEGGTSTPFINAPSWELPAAGGEGGGGGVVPPVIVGGGGGDRGGPSPWAGLLGAGLLSSLLWGGGSGGIPIPLLGGLGAGMAGFGSLASFAGLGPEHLLMTGVGLAGSAAGAVGGGALLGLGSLGVMGVGMGTDLAGVGQAAGDIKSAYSIISNSALTAAQQQQQLNQALQDLTPAARSAVVSAANTASQFHQLFDTLTGPAEAIGAQIIQQAMQVGMAFLPTIGKYAAENMGIIRSDLQPLFTWLQGPGLAIFNLLEAKFQQDLPTAMDAFDQGVELVMRTLGYLAPQTGGLLTTIDQLVTRFNGGGWTQWEVGIQKLIGDFREWEALIKIAVADVYQLFHNDAGTASGIVQSLTQMLTKLHEWETSTAGSAALQNIFETHKQEVLELLQLLPPLVSSFGHIYMTVAPALTQAFTDVLRAIVPVVDAFASNPVGAWILGLTLLAGKLGVLQAVLGPIVTGVLSPFKVALSDIGAALSQSMFGWTGFISRASEAGVAAEGLAGSVARAGEEAAAAGGAEGIGAVSAGIGGMLGPIGLAVGALGIGLIPAFASLLKSGPSAAQQTAQAVQALNQQLAQLPTGTVLQLGVSLDTVSKDVQSLGQSMLALKPGSTQMEIATGKMAALYQASISMSQQMLTMNANLNTLAATFGISTQDVQNFAQEVGVDLKSKLDPTQIHAIGMAVQQSGQDFNQAALAPPKWADAVAQAASKAVDAAQQGNSQINTDLQVASALHTALMNHEGVIGIAQFVDGIQGGLPAVEAIARQFGVTIPQQYLDLLQQAMQSSGAVSIKSLADAISQNMPAVTAALGQIPATVSQIDFKAVAAAAQGGQQIGDSLAQGLRNAIDAAMPGISAEAAANVQHIIEQMKLAAQSNSPSRKTMQLGSDMAEGLRIGLLGGMGGVGEAATSLASVAMASLGGSVGRFHVSGMTLSGPAGGAPSGTVVYHGGPVTVSISGVTAGDVPKIRQAIDEAFEERDREFVATWKQMVGNR